MSIHTLTATVESYGTVQGFVSVRFLRFDGARCQYQWTVYDESHEVIGTGEDLRSGGMEDPNHVKMLASLCSFLTACAESYAYARRHGGDGENADLFPPAVAEWADANSDALEMVREELEPSED